nr:glycosyltransferase [uncultured Marinobacter sp.]
MSLELINNSFDTSWPFISIIIPALNEQDHIESTLKCLNQSDYPRSRFETIVVDNGSTDNTREISEKYASKCLILEKGNVGAVRNYGAKQARGSVLAFLDADCQVSSDWLNNIKNLLQENSDSVFGGTCILADNSNWIERCWILGDAQRKQSDLVGASIATKTSIFWSAGGFSEDITSGEDTELSSRLRLKKIPVIITPLLSVKHSGNAKTIIAFIRRQIWHSENYLVNIKSSLKDPTFILCLTALFFMALTPMLALYSYSSSFLSILIFFGISALFSAKRLIYAKTKPSNIEAFMKIYLLDIIYVTARSIGIMKSLFRIIKNSKK